MSTERSPRFPANSLRESIDHILKLYREAGRTAVTSEVAVRTIGYSGLSGASRTAMAALSGYGLLIREGDTHRISDEALRIIRPIDEKDKLENLRTSAFKPPVFADILERHSDCSEGVLASILLHAGFTDEGSARAARVYKENIAFLEENGYASAQDTPLSSDESRPDEPASTQSKAGIPNPIPSQSGKVLAQYQIPLGANQAQLIFTGNELLPEDFDALSDYVALFKKQFERSRPAKQSTREADGARVTST